MYFKIWNKFYGRKGKFGAKEDGIFMKSKGRKIIGYTIMAFIVWNIVNLFFTPLLSNL